MRAPLVASLILLGCGGTQTVPAATEFMGGRALAPDEDGARELYEYLAANSPDAPVPALPLTVVKNATGLTNLIADKTHGKDVYDRSCRRCHGDPHTGNGRLSSKVSIIPDAYLGL